jgi:hypothetical protein
MHSAVADTALHHAFVHNSDRNDAMAPPVPATTALRYMACIASPSSSQDSNRRRQDALAQLARCNPSISQNCEIQ